jgi:peptide/nickel transport system substrate-binding protein
MLIGRSRDVRMLVVYGYARLVGYDQNFNIVPDILESIESRTSACSP